MFDKRNVKNLYALTPLQEGILFHSLMDETGTTYFEQACFSVRGQINIDLFKAAWKELVFRHDALRTVFVMKNVPQPLQIVLKKREITIGFEDIRALSPEDQSARINEFRRHDLKNPFDLSKDMLIRLNLFKRDPEFYTIVWSFHHIIMDGWSVGIIYEELYRIYGSLIRGAKTELPQPVQFNSYIRWLKTQDTSAARRFWRDYLAEYCQRIGLPRKDNYKTTQVTNKKFSFFLDEAQSLAIFNLALENRVTINTLVQAFWALIVCGANETHDVVFGVTVSGRPANISGIERMVGLFINAVPVRIRLNKEESFASLLVRIHNEATAAKDFHYMSLADIQAETPLKQELFDHLIVFENYPDPSKVQHEEDDKGLTISDFDQFEQTNYDLTVEVFPGEHLCFDLLYNPEIYDESVIMAVERHLQRIVSAVIRDTLIPVGNISVLSATEAEEYRQMLKSYETSALTQYDIAERRMSTRYIPPENDLQQQLSLIWNEVLQRDRIGIDDNFFELGGHSLRATRIVTRIHKELSVEITLQEFFNHSNIRSLSAFIQTKSMIAMNPIARLAPQDDYEVSHAQRRLWILHQMESHFTAYNQSAAFLFKGSFEITAFEKAVNIIAMRHESLRTIFTEKQGEPRQKVLAVFDIKIEFIDLNNETDPEKTARNMAQQFSDRFFDLAKKPPWSVSIIRLDSQRHILLINIHHIICDGWSFVILENEIMDAYQHLISGKQPNFKTLSIQYKEFAAWQNRRMASVSFEAHRNYWHKNLEGEIPVLNLPLDFQRPATRTYNGAILKSFIDKNLTKQLNIFCRQRNVSLFMGLTAILKVLLFRYTNQEDIIIGSPVAGRDHPDLETQIGFFVNTIALRDQVTPDTTFDLLLQTVRSTITEAFDHQIYPFDRLVEKLNVLRDVSRSPIFDVMLVMQNTASILPKFFQNSVSEFDFDIMSSQFDWTIIVWETEEGLTLNINYNTDLFAQATIERLSSHFKTLIFSVLDNPNFRVDQLNMLTPDELKFLVNDFNALTRFYPQDKIIAELFFEQSMKTPENPAVIHNGEVLIYKDLYTRANSLARYLHETYSVSPDEPVAVLMDRNISMITALLGILIAGGVYLPLDSEYPPERIKYIVKDSNVKIIITSAAQRDKAASLNLSHMIDISKIPLCARENLPVSITPRNLAYIIYTSGSTGQPKGVMIEHQGFVNMIFAQIEGFGITDHDRVLQFAPSVFDASMSEIFMALLCGAAVIMIDRDDINDTERFLAYLRQTSATVITLPPVYLRMLNHNPLPTVRTLITAGEPAVMEDAIYYARTKNYFNAYGPTETSVCTSFHKVNPHRQYIDRIPIGTPIANNAVYILDERLNPVPVGVLGEICFAGIGLSRGYLNLPDLTAQKFITHPLVSSGRLYRTGDLGRWLADGNIEFLGRLDDQVKLRGFRIEPGEIENSLKSFPGIEDALAVVLNDQQKTSKLCIYMVTRENLNSHDLKRHLSKSLPSYMIPNFFIPLSRFPMTINGKIDKRALPNPMATGFVQIRKTIEDQAKFHTPVEAMLLSVWQKLFERSDFGITDDFFSLGGDSIKAIQMVSLLREKGIGLRVKDIFQWPAICDLVSHITDIKITAQQEPVIGSILKTPIYIWFFRHFKEHSYHFNHADLFLFQKRLNPIALQEALEALTIHHDMLRLICRDKEKEIGLSIVESFSSKFLKIVNLCGQPYQMASARLTNISIAAQTEFDLTKGPLLKVIIFQLDDGDRLFLLMHHLLGDAISWRIILEDLSTAYNQRILEQTIQLPSKTDSFKSWANALNEFAISKQLLSQKDYWQKVISHKRGILPSDSKSFPSVMEDMVRLQTVLDIEETSELNYASQKLKAGVDELLLSVLGVCFSLQHGQTNTLISLESHGRPELFDGIDVSRTVGWFTATFPFSIVCPSIDDPAAWIEAVKKSLKQIPDKGIGWGILKYITPKDFTKDLDFTIEPDINFNYLGEFEIYDKDFFISAGEHYGTGIASQACVIHDLDINAVVAEKRLHILWAYNHHRFRESRIKQMINDFNTCLQKLFAVNKKK